MKPRELLDWCAGTADEFRKREQELEGNRDRDTVLVQYVISVLADPGKDGSEQLVEIIDRARSGAVVANRAAA